MPITGFELGRLLDQNASESYTSFLDSTRKNRLFRQSFVNLIERKYLQNIDQRIQDEISSLKKTNVSKPVYSDSLIHTRKLPITTVFFGAVPPTVFSSKPHSLDATAIGTQIIITDVQGIASSTVVGTITGIPTSVSIQFTIIGPAPVGVPVNNTGGVTLTNMCADYWHLAAVRTNYVQAVNNWSVVGASATTPININIGDYNFFRTGQQLTISGVLGNTAANGTFWIKKINSWKFALYTDEALTVPVASNGAYTSGGAITIHYNQYCKPWVSDNKITVWKPTPQSPRVETADNYLKFYPEDSGQANLTGVLIDYWTVPPVQISVQDTTTDLLLTYPEKFLMAIVDEALRGYADEARDFALRETTQNDQSINS